MSHHDPLSFERPDEFDPERWLHEDKAQRPKELGRVWDAEDPLKSPLPVQFRILLHQLLRRFVIERPDPADGHGAAYSSPRRLSGAVHPAAEETLCAPLV